MTEKPQPKPLSAGMVAAIQDAKQGGTSLKEPIEAAKALLEEAKTWAGNNHGDRAMRLLPDLIKRIAELEATIAELEGLATDAAAHPELVAERDELLMVVGRLNGGAELQQLMRRNNELVAEIERLTKELDIVSTDVWRAADAAIDKHVGRAEAEVTRLREALTEIAEGEWYYAGSTIQGGPDPTRKVPGRWATIARAALNPAG